MWALWVVGALAATGPDCSVKLVGYSTDETQLLVRSEEEADYTSIEMALVGLDGKKVRSWPVLTAEDKDDQAVRSKNWSAAEADLKKLGVTVDAQLQPVSMDLGGLGTTLEVVETVVGDSDGSTHEFNLVATRDGWTRIVEHIGGFHTMSSAMGRELPGFSLYLLPSKKHLMVVWSDSCSGSVVSVHEMSDLVF